MADKYKAFISYSHADASWGDWLHKALETYKIPKQLIGSDGANGPVPKTLFPIFRDREELPTSVDLGGVIRTALEGSGHLIVICSPRSAKSQWVNEEILSFKQMGGENKILAIIVDGEPNATDKDGFSSDDECFPEALKYCIGADGQLTNKRTEPIAADARNGKDGKENAKLKLLAGLMGVNYNDLKQREKVRQRNQRIFTTVATVSILGIIFGVWYQGFLEQQAEERARLFAEAEPFAAEAHRLLDQGFPQAALAAINKALPPNLDDPEWPIIRAAETALVRAVFDTYNFKYFEHKMNTGAYGFSGIRQSPDKRYILGMDNDKTLTLMDLVDQKVMNTLNVNEVAGGFSFKTQAWFHDNETIRIISSNNNKITYWDWAFKNSENPSEPKELDGEIEFHLMDLKSRVGIQAFTNASYLQVFDFEAMKMGERIPTNSPEKRSARIGLCLGGGYTYQVVLPEDNDGGKIIIYDLKTGKIVLSQGGVKGIASNFSFYEVSQKNAVVCHPTKPLVAMAFGSGSKTTKLIIHDVEKNTTVIDKTITHFSDKIPSPILIPSEGDEAFVLFDEGNMVTLFNWEGVELSSKETFLGSVYKSKLFNPTPGAHHLYVEANGNDIKHIDFSDPRRQKQLRGKTFTGENLLWIGRDQSGETTYTVHQKGVLTWSKPVWGTTVFHRKDLGRIVKFALGEDEKLMALADEKGHLVVQNTDTGELVGRFPPSSVLPGEEGLEIVILKLMAKDSRLVTFVRPVISRNLKKYSPGIITVLDVNTGDVIYEKSGIIVPPLVLANWDSTTNKEVQKNEIMVTNPKGRGLGAGMGLGADIINVETGEIDRSLNHDNENFVAAYLTRGGSVAAFVDSKNNIQVYETTGKFLTWYNGINAPLRFSDRKKDDFNQKSYSGPTLVKFRPDGGALFVKYQGKVFSMLNIGALVDGTLKDQRPFTGKGFEATRFENVIWNEMGYMFIDNMIPPNVWSFAQGRDGVQISQKIPNVTWSKSINIMGKKEIIIQGFNGANILDLEKLEITEPLNCPFYPQDSNFFGSSSNFKTPVLENQILFSNEHRICVWDRASKTILARFHDNPSSIIQLESTKDEKQVYALDYSGVLLGIDLSTSLRKLTKSVRPTLLKLLGNPLDMKTENKAAPEKGS
jgi:WD40 repeat protein